MTQEKLLTPAELAQRWGLHRATILRLFHEGSIPGVVLTRGAEKSTIRFRLSAIEGFEQARERPESGTKTSPAR
jgi:excisionase family DNA binding protein